MSYDLLISAANQVIENIKLKASATNSLGDRVAKQLLEQKDNDVMVINVPLADSDEERMEILRILYNLFSSYANIISIYPGLSKTDIFGVKTEDRFYAYQRVNSDCLKDNVYYPKTTMYVIECKHVAESHFPKSDGTTHWDYLDKFRDEHFNL